MESVPGEKFEEMRRQAYLDSHSSAQQIIDRHRNRTDPILQQNDYYVSKNKK